MKTLFFNIFLTLFSMSLEAGWVVLAICLIRALFRDMPKNIRCFLWCFTALRLLCPFWAESGISLVPDTQILTDKLFLQASSNFSNSIQNSSAVNFPSIGTDFFTQTLSAADELNLSTTASIWNTHSETFKTSVLFIWTVGFILLHGFNIAQTIRLKKKINISLRIKKDVWICDEIQIPFLWGMFKPRIYLPSNLEEPQRTHAVLHERAHAKRLDHIWKALGFLLLTLYWFHPLIWTAYILFCQDIELACDETVIRHMDLSNRQTYAHSLLSMSCFEKNPVIYPSFSGNRIKNRLQAIARYKQPGRRCKLLSVALCLAATLCFLTTPRLNAQETGTPVETEQEFFIEALESRDSFTETESYLGAVAAEDMIEASGETSDMLSAENNLNQNLEDTVSLSFQKLAPGEIVIYPNTFSLKCGDAVFFHAVYVQSGFTAEAVLISENESELVQKISGGTGEGLLLIEESGEYQLAVRCSKGNTQYLDTALMPVEISGTIAFKLYPSEEEQLLENIFDMNQ